MSRRFRKKPVEVEAVQWLGDNEAEIKELTGESFRYNAEFSINNVAMVYDRLHDSWINVFPGQWVVKGVQGEFYPIDEAVLDQTYSALCFTCGHLVADHVHEAVGACICGCDGPWNGPAQVQLVSI